jgi:glycosyltransferase involved in cell wall biosynthesis
LADTYGVALLEAMSCGCPVVASDTGGPGELVREDRGIRVPLTTPERYAEEFAAALVALASNPDLRSRLGANARRYVVEEHDWDRLGGRLLEIYEGFTARLGLGVARAAG